MNYCHNCQSSYSVPGTCNCFAPIVSAGSATPQWYHPVLPHPIPCKPAEPSLQLGGAIHVDPEAVLAWRVQFPAA